MRGEAKNLTEKFDFDVSSATINDLPYKIVEITQLFDYFSNERAILLYHGEHYDGSGYPEYLLGCESTGTESVNFETGSTGLGLYFASQAARMHKNKGKEGFISISNDGHYSGGCFTIALP